MRAALLAAHLVASSLLLAPVSHADTNDDSFLTAVRSIGITGPDSSLIHNGHASCNKMDDGETPDGVVADIIDNTSITSQSVAANFVAASARFYCPWHLKDHVHTGTSVDSLLPPADGSMWVGIIV